MTAILEDLDIAEVLAYRNANTPLWDDLMDAYDADAVTAMGAGWPPVMTSPVEPASEEADDESDDESEGGDAEADEEPAADSPDPAPAEAEPTAS
jgi:hypothetical protein